LPGKVREIVPSPPPPAGVWPAVRHARRMLTLAGCVQPALAPRTNAAAARVLDRLGISLQEMRAPCCGALRFHLGRQDAGLDDARGVIDTLWAQVATGTVEAIVMTASGCGAMVRDYARLLSSDRIYAERAARISALCRDLSEVVDAERTALAALVLPAHDRAADAPIVVHSPCTLQHAQRLEGLVERVLECTGRPLTRAADPDQCCGSAGTYSIVQPQLARTLRGRKLAALEGSRPAVIATANVGCQHHLQAGTATPVCHWIELVDEALAR
jgi:glycolate oxidase iron-sulfur subunit